MTESLHEIIRTGDEGQRDAAFPHAPPGWTREQAVVAAEAEGLILKDDHWKSVRALHEFFARHGGTTINARAVHDALGEKFHSQGGIRYLYVLFPGGPVAQGCRIAGLKAPAGATDRGFGSVV